MSADKYTTATELAILQAGRAPEWDSHDDTAPPASASDGVPLSGAVRTLVAVALREDPHHRTVRLGTDGTLTGTYTVEIDGNTVTYNATAGAPANEAALVTAIAAAINASLTVGALVTATAVDDDDTTNGTLTTVRLRGVGEADYSVDFTHSGAAVLTAVADLCSATMRPWWAMSARSGSTAPTPWFGSGDSYAVDYRGRVERFETAGFSRAYVQLSARDGHVDDGAGVTYADPTIAVGPCLSEV